MAAGGLIPDIWRSFRALPLWVRIWVALALLPVNMASLLFMDGAHGKLIAALAVGGMLPNLWFMIRERGLSRIMALSHLAFWTPLLPIVALTLIGDAAGGRAWFLAALLAVDAASLGFDLPDAWKWLKGRRAVAGAPGA